MGKWGFGDLGKWGFGDLLFLSLVFVHVNCINGIPGPGTTNNQITP